MKCAKRPDNLESSYDSKPCKIRKLTADQGTERETDDTGSEQVNSSQSEQNLETLPETNCDNIRSDDPVCDDLAHGDEEMETILQCSSEIMRIVGEIAVSDPKAESVVKKVVRDLERALGRFSQPFRILAFGSHINGLACKTSDLDFCFKIILNDPAEVPHVQELLRKTANLLRRNRCFDTVTRISKARIPIIKFKHKPTGKDCDLSFSGELGVQNTLLIRWYLSVNHNLKPLVLFLKYLLQRYNLHGTGKLTTYMLFWLVVYYLQQRDILPPVKTVRECVPQSHIVYGWDCRVPKKNQQPVGDPFNVIFHVKEFLKFYSHFEFLKYVVSPYLACTIPVDDFDNLRIPATAFATYLGKMENENDVKFTLGLMNVQDPTEHNVNITKPIEVKCLNQFKEFCYYLFNFFTYDLGAKLKSAPALQDILPKELPSVKAINNNWVQYMCLTVNSERLPSSHELKNTFEQDSIRYFSDSLQNVMQTAFQLKVQKVYTNEVKTVYRKNNELSTSVIPMSCLTCFSETGSWKNTITASKENRENNLETDNLSDSLHTFILLKTPPTRKEVRIYIESKACFISYLKYKLAHLLLPPSNITPVVSVSESK